MSIVEPNLNKKRGDRDVPRPSFWGGDRNSNYPTDFFANCNYQEIPIF